MKAKGIFIATLLVVDTFFIAYAYGFHSRHVLVIDAKLPPLKTVEVKVKSEPSLKALPAKKVDAKKTAKAVKASKSSKTVKATTVKKTEKKHQP